MNQRNTSDSLALPCQPLHPIIALEESARVKLQTQTHLSKGIHTKRNRYSRIDWFSFFSFSFLSLPLASFISLCSSQCTIFANTLICFHGSTSTHIPWKQHSATETSKQFNMLIFPCAHTEFASRFCWAWHSFISFFSAPCNWRVFSLWLDFGQASNLICTVFFIAQNLRISKNRIWC